ncbi:hypothetical protein FOE78_14070 [Microlunatus elymi]|uniref:Sulfotransferase family protein n=1 Tax=Microlunatus elymi TaxID=2596828 RepID=A0A516Q0C9_9ACTN|nr:hypothetical protein [Microlunatus elymi]QDP96893.1 hypothetical protein FOE78_14070 [Microlunatus elymi]
MLIREPSDELLLPERTRLLHIGPMKTGTTSVQAAASARRDQLLAHGVRYPGNDFNHRRQFGALMGWSVDTWRRSDRLRPDLLDVATSGVPSKKVWSRLRAEIDGDQDRRIFLSHEFASQADDAIAERIVDAVGDRVHVCITLRAPGLIVPSLWSQEIRDDALTEPLEEWLRRFYGRSAQHPISARFQRAYDQSGLVDRWARLVGPRNVTVIIVDHADPSLMTSSFEAMLGLPAGMLDWNRSNRSLTGIDAELFRQANVMMRDRGVDWRSFYSLVWKGAIQLGPEQRKVPAGGPRVMLPPWAGEIADKDGRRFADEIGAMDVRVVGDLDNLAVESRTAPWQDITEIPIEIAADAVAAGVLAGQQSRERFLATELANQEQIAKLRQQLARETTRSLADRARAIPANRRAEQLAGAFSSRELAAALKRRLLHRLRTRQSYPRER